MSRKMKIGIIWSIRIAAAIIVLMVGCYSAFSDRYFDTVYDYVKSFNEIKPIEFQQGDTLEQAVSFAMDRIRNIGICMVERTSECAGRLNIAIADENNNLVWQEWLDVEALQTRCITWLDVQQNVEPQKGYILRFSADAMTGILYIGAINADDSSEIAKENASQNGNKLSEPIVVEAAFYARLDWQMSVIIFAGTLVVVSYLIGLERLFLNKKRSIVTLFLTIDILIISIYLRGGFEKSLNYKMFTGLMLAFLAAAVMYLFMLFKKVDKVELYFIGSTLIFGTVYSVILPPYSMPDEPVHFAQAYRLSNAIMGQPINDGNGFIYMRECDINYREPYPNREYTIDMIKALIKGECDRSETMTSSESKIEMAVPVTMYVPQAIGITLGRLLHVNYARLLYMARLMNFLVFIFITYWAIKVIPCGKWIFFAICQIPMLLETVFSCSYDTPILAFTFLFVAYLLKLCVQTEKVQISQMLVLAGVAFILAPLKPVYAPLVALVFLIPDKNMSDKKRQSRLCKLMVVGVAAIAVLLVYKYSFGAMSQIKSDNTPIKAETVQSRESNVTIEASYQIDNNEPYRWPSLEYMIENPFNLVESLMGAYIVYADEYWQAMFGCGLGPLWYLKNPAYMGVLAMIVLYLSYRKDNGQGNYIVNLQGKLWIGLIIAGSLFGIFLAMYLSYSEPSGKVIGGVQGRYMLPLLIVLPFFLRKKEYPNGRTKTTIIMLSLTVQIMVILNTSMQIWNR